MSPALQSIASTLVNGRYYARFENKASMEAWDPDYILHWGQWTREWDGPGWYRADGKVVEDWDLEEWEWETAWKFNKIDKSPVEDDYEFETGV